MDRKRKHRIELNPFCSLKDRLEYLALKTALEARSLELPSNFYLSFKCHMLIGFLTAIRLSSNSIFCMARGGITSLLKWLDADRRATSK